MRRCLGGVIVNWCDDDYDFTKVRTWYVGAIVMQFDGGLLAGYSLERAVIFFIMGDVCNCR